MECSPFNSLSICRTTLCNFHIIKIFQLNVQTLQHIPIAKAHVLSEHLIHKGIRGTAVRVNSGQIGGLGKQIPMAANKLVGEGEHTAQAQGSIPILLPTTLRFDSHSHYHWIYLV